jgi:hypothetical protein
MAFYENTENFCKKDLQQLKRDVILSKQNTKKWSSNSKSFVRELSVGARHERSSCELTMEWSG